jgi:hypothetical protein
MNAPARALWTRQKQARRAEREAAWSARIAYASDFRDTPLHGVILTDDLYRPTLPAAAHDCVAFVWTMPDQLPAGQAALKRWGFSYRTGFACLLPPDRCVPDPWTPPIVQSHALVLVGGRGEVVAPAPGTQFPSVLRDRDALDAMLRRYFPTLLRIDLWREGAP